MMDITQMDQVLSATESDGLFVFGELLKELEEQKAPEDAVTMLRLFAYGTIQDQGERLHHRTNSSTHSP